MTLGWRLAGLAAAAENALVRISDASTTGFAQLTKHSRTLPEGGAKDLNRQDRTGLAKSAKKQQRNRFSECIRYGCTCCALRISSSACRSSPLALSACASTAWAF